MRGDVWTKEIFGLWIKVPFVTDRFRLNLERLYRVGRQCHVWCFPYPFAMPGEIGRKNFLASRTKCPSLLTDLVQICNEGIAWTGRARSDVSVTPLQCEAREGRKSVWAWRVQCRSLLTDFDQTCEARKRRKTLSASGVKFHSLLTDFEQTCIIVTREQAVPRVMFQLPRCNTMRGMDKNCFGLKSKVAFFSDRIRPKLHPLRIRRECCVWCLCCHAAIQGQRGAKNCFGLKSKLPFITGRFGPNVSWFWRMRRECIVWCFPHHTSIQGEGGGGEKLFRPQV
jgi:hypothetical protein